MKALSVLVIATLLALPARAALNISNKPTKNVDCSAGICSANADDANLNTGDLEALLASSDIRVLTEAEIAQDIVILSPLNWSSSHALSLETKDSIILRNKITVEGTAHLSFAVPGGATFQKKGAVHFWDTASHLTIDGDDYRLVNSVTALAAMVAAHPKGRIALADDYNAKQDGQIRRVPVQTEFAGTFDGLGNKISNFAIWDTVDNNIALFAATKKKGTIRNLGITNVNILAENTFTNFSGGLVAYNGGTIVNCYVDGGTVRTDFDGTLGGLAGLNYGNIYRSWANVSVEGAQSAEVGGLVGNSHGRLVDDYAIGRVIAGDQSYVAGLVGYTFGHIEHAYATGNVDGGQNAIVGGLIGQNFATVQETYWDTTASGTETGIASGDASGATGLTTEELQAALPDGFSPSTWAQSPKVNGGLPYLLTNPPK